MRISSKGRQAVMAMVDLMRNAKNHPVSLAEVAKRQDISLSYLEQLIARLKRHHLVKSTRGPGGGYMLGDKGAAITIGEIISSVDDAQPKIVIDNPATASVRDLTDAIWQTIDDQITDYLSDVTLADVDNGMVKGVVKETAKVINLNR